MTSPRSITIYLNKKWEENISKYPSLNLRCRLPSMKKENEKKKEEEIEAEGRGGIEGKAY
jgi:hypothetical protein